MTQLDLIITMLYASAWIVALKYLRRRDERVTHEMWAPYFEWLRREKWTSNL